VPLSSFHIENLCSSCSARYLSIGSIPMKVVIILSIRPEGKSASIPRVRRAVRRWDLSSAWVISYLSDRRQCLARFSCVKAKVGLASTGMVDAGDFDGEEAEDEGGEDDEQDVPLMDIS
jgi:hypothetical protein